jgi:mannosyltransferase
LAVAPLVVFGWAQRGQISWIRRPGWADAGAMLASLGGGPLALAIAVWALAAAGCATALAAARGRRGAGGWRLARLALPWLAIPPVVMLAVSQAMPVYNFRYVVFCVPALALLAGLGLAAVGWVWRAGAVMLILALAVPAQLAMRVPGTGLRQAASILAAAERPGDAIVYPRTDIPPWYLAYPAGFARLDNIGMARSPAVSGRLYGVSVPLALLKQREQHAQRIWVVEMESWQDPARYLSSGFRLRHAWQLDHGYLQIWLYQRELGTRQVARQSRHDQAQVARRATAQCLARVLLTASPAWHIRLRRADDRAQGNHHRRLACCILRPRRARTGRA